MISGEDVLGCYSSQRSLANAPLHLAPHPPLPGLLSVAPRNEGSPIANSRLPIKHFRMPTSSLHGWGTPRRKRCHPTRIQTQKHSGSRNVSPPRSRHLSHKPMVSVFDRPWWATIVRRKCVTCPRGIKSISSLSSAEDQSSAHAKLCIVALLCKAAALASNIQPLDGANRGCLFRKNVHVLKLARWWFSPRYDIRHSIPRFCTDSFAGSLCVLRYSFFSLAALCFSAALLLDRAVMFGRALRYFFSCLTALDLSAALLFEFVYLSFSLLLFCLLLFISLSLCGGYHRELGWGWWVGVVLLFPNCAGRPPKRSCPPDITMASIFRNDADELSSITQHGHRPNGCTIARHRCLLASGVSAYAY